MLIGGLEPARVYWYRFTDADGNGSRVGRTITAPLPDDPRVVNFAFVSCQDVNEGKLKRLSPKMIHEDERAPAAERLGFVLHLGDFIYEVIEYPDEVKTRYDRTVYEVARLPDGHKVGNFHIPLTLDGYRAIYKGYLADPDLQDARARWPFVAMWDNHEFSWQGWQSIVKAGSFEVPGQTIKVAANQAWFEYLPVRMSRRRAARWSASIRRPSRTSRSRSSTATGSASSRTTWWRSTACRAYRTLRWGRCLDLIITDQHSYRNADPFSDPSMEKLGGDEFIDMFPESGMRVPGRRARLRRRQAAGGDPASTTRMHPQPATQGAAADDPRRGRRRPGSRSKLKKSTAVWKIWGNSEGAPGFARRSRRTCRRA